MASYTQLRRQLESLQAEVEFARKAELLPIIKRMQRDMATYGITAADLSSETASVKTVAKEVAGKKRGGRGGTPRYREPKSGSTWSGFGRAPGWIAKARDRTKFLIDAPTDVGHAKSKTSAKASPATARKRSRAATSSPATKTPAASKRRIAPNKRVASGAAAKKAVSAKKRAPKISRNQTSTSSTAGDNPISAADVSGAPAS